MQQFLGRALGQGSGTAEAGGAIQTAAPVGEVPCSATASTAANSSSGGNSSASATVSGCGDKTSNVAMLQTALLRREGENFLLMAQVQKLQQQSSKASESALNLAAQLAQVLQNTDSSRSIKLPDRVRTLVSNVQRGLQRLGTNADIVVSSDAGSLRRLTSSSEGARQGPGSDRSSAVEPAHIDPAQAQQQTADRRNARLAKEQYEKERQRRLDLEAKTKSQASSLMAEEKRCRMLQEERDQVVDEAESLKRQLEELRAAHVELESSRGSPEPCLPTTAAGKFKASCQGAAPQNTDQQLEQEYLAAQLELYKPHFIQQRELLVRLIRKGAVLEDEKMTLIDDVTRRNVVIHKLREDLQQEQQNVQQQYHQFTQQQQQQSQQSQQQQQQQHMQQLQQLQQLQKLQALLQAQQSQLSLQQQRQPSADGAAAAAVAEVRGSMEMTMQQGGGEDDMVPTASMEQILQERTVQKLIEEIQHRDSEICSLKAVVRDTCNDVQILAGSTESLQPEEVLHRPSELPGPGDVLVWPGRNGTSAPPS